MKKLFIYAIGLTFVIGSMAVSCDGVDDLLDITTGTEFAKTVNLNSNGATSEALTEVVETIDPSSDLEEYGDRIKDVEIDSITLLVAPKASGHNEDASLSLSVGISEFESSNVLNVFSTANGLATINEEFTLTVDDNVLTAVKAYLMALEKFDLHVDGQLENGPANVDVSFTIYGHITASPLE